MPIQNPRDLFWHELGKMHQVEKQSLQVMQQMSPQVQNTQFKNLLQQHITETQQQIRNIEQCFTQAGQKVPSVQSYASEGMTRDLQTIQQQNPPPELLELAALVAGIECKHFETGCYWGLIGWAQALNEQQCVMWLEQNLRQEESMARQFDQINKQFSPQVAQRYPRAA